MISLAEEFLDSLDKILEAVGFEKIDATAYKFEEVTLNVKVSFEGLPKVEFYYGNKKFSGYLTTVRDTKLFVFEDGTVVFDSSRDNTYSGSKAIIYDIVAFTMNYLNSTRNEP